MLGVLTQIKQHTSENISCIKIAESFNMSEVQLMRSFKKCVGIPLRRFRFWHRLSAASHYWLRNQCTMADAAMSAGFSDSAHFNRCFKKSLGMPPGFLLGLDRQVNVFMDEPNAFCDPSLSLKSALSREIKALV
jgi:transcriptional regulator GlxA family with amidase domain